MVDRDHQDLFRGKIVVGKVPEYIHLDGKLSTG